MLHRERYHTPGFTFMELVVAILILGLLSAIGIPLYMRWAESARETTTKQNLQLLKNNINLFHIEHGKYPTRLEDLVERPKGDLAKNWKQLLEKLPQDGWRQDFYYRVIPGGKHPYDLYSYGGSNGPEEPAEKRISAWEL